MEKSDQNNVKEYGRFFSWPRVFAFGLAMILVEFFYTSLTTGISIDTLALDAEIGVVLAAFLLWLVYNLKLRPVHVFLLVWLTMFVVRYFNNVIEGYFFTDVFGSVGELGMSLLLSLLMAFLIAVATGFILLHPELNDSLWDRSKDMLSRRSTRDWIVRIAAASPLFFAVYFVFGMAVSPFVYPYYTDPSLGLTIPSFWVMIPVELLRGLIFTLALIPLIIAVGTGKFYVFLATSLMLFIPGSLIPLLEAPLPLAIIPFHITELFADSMVFGLILTLLFTPPSRKITAGSGVKA